MNVGKRIQRDFFLLILFIASIFFFIGSSSAIEWNINPGESIQEVVNQASPNDTITLNGNGTYNENVIIDKDNLTIKGNGNVTVQGLDPNKPIFTFNSSLNSILDGLTITGANNSSGILLDNSNAFRIINNHFTGNFVSMNFKNASENTISNNYLEMSTIGILVNMGTFNFIQNNTISNNYIGIEINSSDFNIIDNGNKFESNNYGILLVDNFFNDISGNSFISNSSNSTAIKIESCSKISITNNTIKKGGFGVYSMGGTNNLYSGNSISQTSYNAIYLNSPFLNIISDNQLSGSSTGLFINGGSNNQFYANQISQTKYGIELSNSNNNIFYNNSLNIHTYGFYIHNMSFSSIYSNIITNTNSAIKMHDSNENDLFYNVINDNKCGAFIVNGNDNNIESNSFNSNAYVGTSIKLENSSGNLINENIIKGYNNSLNYGIYVKGGSENLLLHNNVESNYVGLEVNNSTLNTVNFNTFKNNNLGVLAFLALNITINCNNFTNNSAGIELHQSKAIFNENIIVMNTVGLLAEKCQENLIDFNLFVENDVALQIYESTGILVKDNVFSNNSFSVLSNGGTLNTISNNNITDVRDLGIGIYIENSSHNTISGNNIINTFKKFTKGLFISTCSQNTVFYNLIENFYCGIELLNTNSNGLEFNIVQNNTLGLVLYNCILITLSGNTIKNNGAGIEAHNSNNITLQQKNLIENNTMGFSLLKSSGIIIDDNIFNDNCVALELLNSSYNLIKSTTFDRNGYGVYVSEGIENIIILLNVYNTKPNGYGIRLENTQYSQLSYNIIKNYEKIFSYGLSLKNCSQCVLIGNEVTNHQNGLKINLSTFNNFTQNNFENNTIGIFVMGGTNNLFLQNVVESNDIGFEFHNSSYAELKQNNIIANNFGLYLSNLFGSNITSNNISNNFQPLQMENGSSNNQIYHNNLAINFLKANVSTSCTNNTFFLDLPSGGNYWSDYNGTDSNRDGIGDFPYIFNGGIDYLPYIGFIHSVYPEDSIGTTIDNSFPGDVILVHGNNPDQVIYRENLLINKKIIIKSLNEGQITLQAANVNRPLIKIYKNLDKGEDGSGTTITGFILTGATASSAAALTLEYVDNCLISNNIITDNRRAISIFGSSGNKIRNNQIYNNVDSGIMIIGSPLTIMRNNQILNNNQNFYVDKLYNNNDFDQDIDTSNTINGKAIYYLYKQNNQVFENEEMGYTALIKCNNITLEKINLINMEEILLVNTTNSSISNSNLNCLFNGIRLINSSFNKIENNSIIDNQYSGIILFDSNNNTIQGNNVTNNMFGFEVYHSAGNMLDNNSINNNAEYNFYIDSWDLEGYNNIIGSSNTINGRSIYYLVNKTDEIYDGNVLNVGYLALVQCSNMTIQNLNISHNSQGILLVATNTTQIKNSYFSDNFDGIYLYNSSYNTLYANNITAEPNSFRCSMAINLREQSNHNYIQNNVINDTNGGITIETSSKNNIVSNQMNIIEGIMIKSSSQNLLRNNIINTKNQTTNFGISGNELTHYQQDIDSSNTINGRSIYYLVNKTDEIYDGNILNVGYLALVQCSNMTIQNLNISHNSQGILLAATTNTTIQNCTITNNYDGIYLWNSSDNHVLNNELTYNTLGGMKSGLNLENNSNDNQISNNLLCNNEIGLLVSNSSRNNIVANNISSNTIEGAVLEQESQNNTLTNNIIIENWGNGIIILNSTGCQIIGNLVVDNSMGIYTNRGNNSINLNRIVGNVKYGLENIDNTSINAQNNWWGQNDGSVGYISGNVTATTWLIVGISSSSKLIPKEGNSTIVIDMRFNNIGQQFSEDLQSRIISVSMQSSLGTIIPESIVLSTDGLLECIFRASSYVGIANITANIDCQSISTFVNVAETADISVSMEVSNQNPHVGDNVTYYLNVTNTGPENAYLVMLNDLLTSGLIYINSTATQGIYDQNSGKWNITHLNANSTVTLEILTQVAPEYEGNNISNHVSVDNTISGYYDPNITNDQDIVELYVMP